MMEQYLPLEMWRHIFGFFELCELLDGRFVCKNWNEIIVTLPLTSKIVIRNNKEMEKFFEYMKTRNINHLKFQSFILGIYAISLENLNVFVQYCGTDVVELFFSRRFSSVRIIINHEDDQAEIQEIEKLQILLNGSPNLEILGGLEYMDNDLDLNPLLRLHTVNDASASFYLLKSLILKAPNLKVVGGTLICSSNKSKVKSMHELLQLVPRLNLHYYISRCYMMDYLLQFPITLNSLCLDIGQRCGFYDCIRHRYIYSSLSQQSESLTTLTLRFICPSDIKIPPMRKLHTLCLVEEREVEEFPNNALRMRIHRVNMKPLYIPFDPKNFPSLKYFHLNIAESQNVQDDSFPNTFLSVKKLMIKSAPPLLYSQWSRIFPNIKVFYISCDNLEFLKFVLADLPTIHQLVLTFEPRITAMGYAEIYQKSNEEMLKYLIENPPPVIELSLYVTMKGEEGKEEIEYENCYRENLNVWNILTGNAKVAPDSVFAIDGMNVVSPFTKLLRGKSLNNLKNLKYLVMREYGLNTDSIMALAYLSQQESYLQLNYLDIIYCGSPDEDGYPKTIRDEIPEEVINILKKKYVHKVKIRKEVKVQ